MVSVQASRFALLHVDDDADEDIAEVEQPSDGKGQSNQSKSKKKNKKKRRVAEENQELRNIAFGGGAKAKQKTKSSNHSKGGSGDQPAGDWALWRKQDEEFTTETYEKDLQHALLESKLQFEEHKQVKQELTDQGIIVTESGKQKKKKKASSKPPPMTLDQFRQLEPEPPRRDSSDEEELPQENSPTTHVLDPDSKYFKGVSEEVLNILRKEKLQEKYQKQYAVENVRTQKYQEEIDKRDVELEQFRKDNKVLKDELKQVKKRNQQLCHILGQGEMKDKTKILMELEDLRQVRDELTQEVSQLTIDLEKERSKSRHAQGDNSKHKGGKHK